MSSLQVQLCHFCNFWAQKNIVAFLCIFTKITLYFVCLLYHLAQYIFNILKKYRHFYLLLSLFSIHLLFTITFTL